MLPWVLFSGSSVLVIVMFIILWRVLHKHKKSIEMLHRERAESLFLQDDSHKGHVRRINREFQQVQDQKLLAFVEDLLPSLDALSKALLAARTSSGEEDELVSGLVMVQQELYKILGTQGVRMVDAGLGVAFDPHIHESVGVLETDECPKGLVANCLRVGWEHDSGVLRPSLVQLAVSVTHSDPVSVPESFSDSDTSIVPDTSVDLDSDCEIDQMEG